jgi:hypothetical protein
MVLVVGCTRRILGRCGAQRGVAMRDPMEKSHAQLLLPARDEGDARSEKHRLRFAKGHKKSMNQIFTFTVSGSDAKKI